MTAGDAGEVAARAAGAEVPPRRRHRGDRGQHPRHRRHQPRSADARSAKGSSAKTCSTASTSSRSSCRRCASAPSDVPLIADHFLAQAARARWASRSRASPPRRMAALEAYQWPGNVRELENVVERAVALEQGHRIELATLPDDIRAGRPATPLSAHPLERRASRRRCPRAAPSISSSTCRTSSAQHLERALSRRAACRRTPPNCSGSASGSSATWRRNTTCAERRGDEAAGAGGLVCRRGSGCWRLAATPWRSRAASRRWRSCCRRRMPARLPTRRRAVASAGVNVSQALARLKAGRTYAAAKAGESTIRLTADRRHGDRDPGGRPRGVHALQAVAGAGATARRRQPAGLGEARGARSRPIALPARKPSTSIPAVTRARNGGTSISTSTWWRCSIGSSAPTTWTRTASTSPAFPTAPPACTSTR